MGCGTRTRNTDSKRKVWYPEQIDYSKSSEEYPRLHRNHSEDAFTSQEGFEHVVKELLRQAVRVAFITIIEEEVIAMIGTKLTEQATTNFLYNNNTTHFNVEKVTTISILICCIFFLQKSK